VLALGIVLLGRRALTRGPANEPAIAIPESNLSYLVASEKILDSSIILSEPKHCPKGPVTACSYCSCCFVFSFQQSCRSGYQLRLHNAT
jgi:hypothetical protein